MIPVYTLAGLGASPRMRDDHLAGQLFKAPFERRDCLFPNSNAKAANAIIGEGRVAELAARPGQKVFVGHSMGARILCRFIRSEPDIDPAEVVFILTGNPERKYGGIARSGGAFSDYGGPGIPDDTPFTVYDISRQYAVFEDFPDIAGNKAAVSNALSGVDLHSDYADVQLNDPRNVTFKEGNRYYVLRPTFPMPSCAKWYWSAAREAVEDNKTRPDVEKAYTRPYSVPKQTIKWYPGGGGYDTATRKFVSYPKSFPFNPFP